MTSPQDALARICWRLSADRTAQVLPPAGVSFNELFTYSRGSSAGPSKPLSLFGADESEMAARKSEVKNSIRKATHLATGQPRTFIVMQILPSVRNHKTTFEVSAQTE